MKTRKQYINGECTHREYYSQFVNSYILTQVKNRIGLDRIMRSTDEHFNDIPLKEWDRLAVFDCKDKMDKCGDFLTLLSIVCINKEAARQLIEST